MEPGEAFSSIGRLLLNFKLTFQWPISPPSICNHPCVIVINVLFKKWLKAFRTCLFYYLRIRTAYSIIPHFFNCNNDQLLFALIPACLLYTSPSPRDGLLSRMPSSA